MAFNDFPYTSFHELNADWILQTVKQAREIIDNLNATIAAMQAMDTSLQTEITGLQHANEAINAQLDTIEETLADHTGSLETFAELIAEIRGELGAMQAAVNSLLGRTTSIEGMLADTYDETQRYFKPAIVREEGKLWRCIVDESVPSGATGQFDPTDWTEINLGDELALLQTRFSALTDVVDEMQQALTSQAKVYDVSALAEYNPTQSTLTFTSEGTAKLAEILRNNGAATLIYNDRVGGCYVGFTKHLYSTFAEICLSTITYTPDVVSIRQIYANGFNYATPPTSFVVGPIKNAPITTPLVVTFSGTNADGNAACDSSYNDINTAYNAGRQIVARYAITTTATPTYYYLPSMTVQPNAFTFDSFTSSVEGVENGYLLIDCVVENNPTKPVKCVYYDTL